MRLIDTEILTDYFAEHDLAFEYAIQHQDRKELERLIAEIPTAYDPDKVVEQLEECAKWMCGSREAECPYIGNDEVDCEKCAMLRAIEIVKGCGVDGD